jgi:hypothetical protein
VCRRVQAPPPLSPGLGSSPHHPQGVGLRGVVMSTVHAAAAACLLRAAALNTPTAYPLRRACLLICVDSASARKHPNQSPCARNSLPRRSSGPPPWGLLFSPASMRRQLQSTRCKKARSTRPGPRPSAPIPGPSTRARASSAPCGRTSTACGSGRMRRRGAWRLRLRARRWRARCWCRRA